MWEIALACLALNIYMEARSEPLQGQIAVGQVTLTRANGRVENVCPQVYSPYQFSWTHTVTPLHIKDVTAWNRAWTVAEGVLNNIYPQYSKGATHFHASNVYPNWAAGMKLVAVIGNHKFYKR